MVVCGYGSLGWDGWVKPGVIGQPGASLERFEAGLRCTVERGGVCCKGHRSPLPAGKRAGEVTESVRCRNSENPLPTLWRDAHGCKATVLPRSTLPVTAVKRLTCGPRWHNSPDVVGGQSGAKPSTSDWHLTRGRLLMAIGSCPAVIM